VRIRNVCSCALRLERKISRILHIMFALEICKSQTRIESKESRMFSLSHRCLHKLTISWSAGTTFGYGEESGSKRTSASRTPTSQKVGRATPDRHNGAKFIGTSRLLSAKEKVSGAADGSRGRTASTGEDAVQELSTIETESSGFQWMEVKIKDLPEQRMALSNQGIKVHERTRTEIQERAMREQADFEATNDAKFSFDGKTAQPHYCHVLYAPNLEYFCLAVLPLV
jgi:hypothetical protein